MDYKAKYLKYKEKYLQSRQRGGEFDLRNDFNYFWFKNAFGDSQIEKIKKMQELNDHFLVFKKDNYILALSLELQNISDESFKDEDTIHHVNHIFLEVSYTLRSLINPMSNRIKSVVKNSSSDKYTEIIKIFEAFIYEYNKVVKPLLDDIGNHGNNLNKNKIKTNYITKYLPELKKFTNQLIKLVPIYARYDANNILGPIFYESIIYDSDSAPYAKTKDDKQKYKYREREHPIQPFWIIKGKPATINY